VADRRAKLAADEPDQHSVEWLWHSDRYGWCKLPLPVSLVHVKRRIGETKWEEAVEWSRSRIKDKRFDYRRLETITDPTRGIASRYYQLGTGHAVTAAHTKRSKRQEDDIFRVPPRFADQRTSLQECVRRRPQQQTVGEGEARDEKREAKMEHGCSAAILE
jgi:hypothetical protein